MSCIYRGGCLTPEVCRRNGHCEGDRQPAVTEPLYYLQARGFSGNSLLWWKKGRHGYTAEIRDAEVFSKEAAFSQAKSRPDVDFPWRKDYIDARISHTIDSQKCHRSDSGAV